MTRRDYMSRLRYAFRLSQPLDVLFRSKPFRPCFVSVALMGFHLRRIPLTSSCTAVCYPAAGPSAGSSVFFWTGTDFRRYMPRDVIRRINHADSGTGIQASCESVAAASVTRNPRPAPPLAFTSPRFFPLGSDLRFFLTPLNASFCPADLLSWAWYDALGPEGLPSSHVLYRVSKNRGFGRLFRPCSPSTRFVSSNQPPK